MRSVLVDANVFVSLLTGRHEKQRAVAAALLQFPGVQTTDGCPWRRVFELWPSPFSGLADASIAAVATTERYHAVATFDRKLARRLRDLGVASYWNSHLDLV